MFMNLPVLELILKSIFFCLAFLISSVAVSHESAFEVWGANLTKEVVNLVRSVEEHVDAA